MKRLTVALIVLAALCACSPQRRITVGGPRAGYTYAYLAAKNIPKGTTAATIIARGMIEAKAFSPGGVQRGAITSLADIAHKQALQNIPQGAQLIMSQFGPSRSTEKPNASESP